MFKQIDYIMVYVSDMRRSVEFYRDNLGLALKFESEEWTEFQTGTTALALHGGAKPQQLADENVSNTQNAGTCSIGFSVDDIEKTFKELKSKAVNFTMPPTVRQDEGIKLAVCTDPDGFLISIAETISQ